MDEILKNLTDEQAAVAVEVARKAKEMGINPRLAVALAYRESGFNPAAKGSKGEVGLMQVMPKTAESMGFSGKDLADTSKNIEIGLTYLKRGLDKFGGDPVLAVAGYNAGLDHPYFADPENKSLPESTKEYVKGIGGFGGFTSAEPEPQAQPEPTAPASEEDFQAKKAQLMLDAMGAGAGAGAAKVLDVGKGITDTARAVRSLPQALQAQTMPAAPGMAPGAPAGVRPMQPPVGGPAGPVGGPAGPTSPLRQMGGPGAFNYGKAFGLTDIEAARATDMSKGPGGASDLIRQRSDALQKIQGMGGGYAENPRFGGLMTPEAGVGGGPRASFVQGPEGMTPLPKGAPIPNAPLPAQGPGALSRIMSGIGSGAQAAMNLPMVRGALGGASVAEQGAEAFSRMQQNDPTGAAISSAGALGSAAMMVPNPLVAGIGAAIATASPLTQYLRDKIRSQPPMPEPSARELMEAQRPAFVFPSP